MRIAPGMRASPPRSPLGSMGVNAYHFPAGVDIETPHYSIHHNTEYYTKPFNFQLEPCFVDANITEADAALAQYIFYSFSVRRADFIGNIMA
jgi:hypothetical protein